MNPASVKLRESSRGAASRRPLLLLVEDELALARDLQPVQRTAVLDADLTLAAKDRVAGERPCRRSRWDENMNRRVRPHCDRFPAEEGRIVAVQELVPAFGCVSRAPEIAGSMACLPAG